MFDSSFAHFSRNQSKQKSSRIKIDKGKRVCVRLGKTYRYRCVGAGQSFSELIDGKMIIQN